MAGRDPIGRQLLCHGQNMGCGLWSSRYHEGFSMEGKSTPANWEHNHRILWETNQGFDHGTNGSSNLLPLWVAEVWAWSTSVTNLEVEISPV